MKRTLLTFAATLTALPALAHSGAHMHPHADSAVPVLLGLVVIAAGAAILWRAR